MMPSFLVLSVGMLSGAFSLGAGAFLYLQCRTPLLRNMTLFLLSLLLICNSFWVSELRLLLSLPQDHDLGIMYVLLQQIGVVLNIWVLPWLVASLIGLSFSETIRRAIYIWDLLVLILVLLYTILPQVDHISYVVTVLELLTIIASIVFLALNLGKAPGKGIRRALGWFIVISSIFAGILILDILISTLPIPQLALVDNMSLPAYTIALNIGAFFLSKNILNQPPLLEEGRVSETCVEHYGLTKREREIINHIIDGKTNRRTAEDLFISAKTVENHLYSIYRKMEVRNRVHLISVLQARGRRQGDFPTEKQENSEK